MKGRIAAIIVLLYAVILFLAAVWGAVLERDFNLTTIPVAGLLFLGPAIGVYRRTNWCRIFLGIWALFVFGIFVYIPFSSEFHFRVLYIGILVAAGFPVFLLFFYPPLKIYTQNKPVLVADAPVPPAKRPGL